MTRSFQGSPLLDAAWQAEQRAEPDGRDAEVWKADSGGKDDSNDH